MAIGDKKSAVMQSDIVNDFTTGGAENVLSAEMGKTLAQRPNPNLLDNWYFVDPVDQRSGWVIPPGKTYYITGSEVGGTTDKYYAATLIVESADYSYWAITVDGVTRYVAYDDAVRGYIDVGYTIDRWLAPDRSSVLIVQDDCVEVSNAVASELCVFSQRITLKDYALKVGQTVTLSFIAEAISTANGKIYVAFDNDSMKDYRTTEFTAIVGRKELYSATIEIPESWKQDDTLRMSLFANGNGGMKVFAAKLELGDQQTLAHQDENGNWVLNEIPNYGEQLAKCQRYQNIEKGAVHSVYGRTEGGGTSLSLTLPLPVTPRANGNITIPSMTVAGNGGAVTVAEVNTTAVAKQNGIYFVVSGDFASIGNSEVVNCYLGAGYIADFNL